MRILIIFLLLFSFGCKTKKIANKGSSEGVVKVDNLTKVDSTVSNQIEKRAEKKVEQETEEEEETITESYVALDSAGVTVIKPTTTTKKKSNRTREKVEEKVEEKGSFDKVDKSQYQVKLDSAAKSDFKTEEEVVPTNFIGSIMDVLMPNWIKIVGLLIGLVTSILVAKKMINKGGKDGVSSS
jgi:hypothetical protein